MSLGPSASPHFRCSFPLPPSRSAMKLPTRYALIRSLRWLLVPKSVRLSLVERVTDSDYRKRIADARASKTTLGDDLESLRQERDHEMYTLYQDREVFHTKRLLRKASRLRVPIPSRYTSKMEESEDWERSWDGEWYLSKSAELQLRAVIRQEQKERNETRAHWIAWIAAITGLVGAVTGLLAVGLGE